MRPETKKSTNVKQVVPFFAVAEMGASLKFYLDGLGLEMTKQWVDEGKLRWCWLELGGAGLMLQEYRSEGHGSWRPQGKVGEGVTTVFICEDALAIYHEAKAHGLRPSKPSVGNGMWVTSLSDPDGYRIELIQKRLPASTRPALSDAAARRGNPGCLN